MYVFMTIIIKLGRTLVSATISSPTSSYKVCIFCDATACRLETRVKLRKPQFDCYPSKPFLELCEKPENK
uniref:Secreted protein n=1 Tax=Pararge aegeria TaxID=116150 RepID=S4P6Y2_9NEOP